MRSVRVRNLSSIESSGPSTQSNHNHDDNDDRHAAQSCPGRVPPGSSLQRSAPAAETAFLPPVDEGKPIQFDSEAPRVIELKRISSEHTFLRAELNGVDHGWFAFDTGATGTILHSELARKLGLELACIIHEDAHQTQQLGSWRRFAKFGMCVHE